jgi:hypothetical protein
VLGKYVVRLLESRLQGGAADTAASRMLEPSSLR